MFRSLLPSRLWPRLLLLLAAATAPMLFLLAASAVQDGQAVLDAGHEQVLQLARLGAEQQDDMFQEASGLLSVLARVEEVRRGGEACAAVLRPVVTDHPRIESITLFGLDGAALCGSGAWAGETVGDHPYFQDALTLTQPGQYALSALAASPVSGMPAMRLAVPVRQGESVEPAGVLVVSLGLDWFTRLRLRGPEPAETLYQVFDVRDGTVLARFPDRTRKAGTHHPDHVLMGAVRQFPQGGVVVGPDLDGVPRVFGFAPLPGRDVGPVLAVGLAEQALRAQADAQFWLAVNLAAAALLLTVLAGWIMANRSFMQPIRALGHAASLMGRGDLSVRAVLGRGTAQELRRLGATFARMARRLRDRDAQLSAMRCQLATSEAHHRMLADASNDMITRFDGSFRRVYVSPASRDVLGYQPADLLALSQSLIHPEDAAGVEQTFHGPLLDGQDVAVASYRARHRDGRYIWVESSARRVPDGSGFVVVTRDVTQRKMLEIQLEDANRQLRILIREDGLTGLANRRRFDEALGEEYRRAARGQLHLALIMLDVDHFKPFNDTYGHPAGDGCLRALAGVLGAVPRRPGDLAARYGGEEFAILLSDTDATGAAGIAERLCEAVRALGIRHEHGLGGVVTASVGVAVVRPSPGRAGPAALVEAADTALYQAKAGGRNQVRLSPATAEAVLYRR